MRHGHGPMGLCVRVLIGAFVLIPKATSAQEPEHPLFRAARTSDAALLNSQLRSGTPADLRLPDGTTPLMLAALHGSAEMVSSLLEHGADPNLKNDAGATALLWGARESAKVTALIARGASVDVASEMGNTPLMVASAASDGAKSVALLLEHGAEVVHRNNAGKNALRMAARGGDADTVRVLLEHARKQQKLKKFVNEAGPSVAIAANYGFADIVDLLLDAGANPSRANGQRGNSLHAAMMAGFPEIAEKLLKKNADVTALSQPGETPTAVLAAYTETGNTSLIPLLKQRDVDFTAKNSDQQTALTWARMRGDKELIEAFLKLGAPEGTAPPRPEIPNRTIDWSSGNPSKWIVPAVQRSLDLLQRSSDKFLSVRKTCTSCHHQGLPGVAVGWARDRGFPIRVASKDRIVKRQLTSWRPRTDRVYELDAPFPVPPRFLGWGMWSFAALGHPPDDVTHSVSWYLAATQQKDGRWVAGMLRPPMGGNEILSTVLAIRALQLYPIRGRESETTHRIKRARDWLSNSTAETHQDHAMRLLGLGWAGVASSDLQDDVKWLLKQQRADGGWSQLPGLESDAWATGQTLVALSVGGGLHADHPAYLRGVKRLVETQFEDGSWYVQARAWPFQPYFESDFPHGRDQWISAPATAWAVMALVLAVEGDEVAKLAVAQPTEAGGDEPLAANVSLPPAAKQTVDFAKDIRPIFERSCVGCHGEKDPKASFSVLTREGLLSGGDSELPAITPGAGAKSPLVLYTAGVRPDLLMPPRTAREKYPPLSQKEIGLLRAWIDQGAKFSPSNASAKESP